MPEYTGRESNPNEIARLEKELAIRRFLQAATTLRDEAQQLQRYIDFGVDTLSISVAIDRLSELMEALE